MEKNDTTKVVDVIEEVCEEICDHYCKYPEQYDAEYSDPEEATYRMLDEKCEHCVLRRLF